MITQKDLAEIEQVLQENLPSHESSVATHPTSGLAGERNEESDASLLPGACSPSAPVILPETKRLHSKANRHLEQAIRFLLNDERDLARHHINTALELLNEAELE